MKSVVSRSGSPKTRRSLRAALLRGVLLGLPALLLATVVVARFGLQGPRLGRLISGLLPENRGKLTIDGVNWSLRALADLVTDAPTPVSIDGLRIVDAEGVTVLDVPHADARVKLRSLIGGSFAISELRAGKAFWRFAALKTREGIGFLDALQPKNAPPPSPKPVDPGKPGGFFALSDAVLSDLTAQFDFPGAWGLELRHARVKADLEQSAFNPLHPTFGFVASSVVAEGGGYLRVIDDVLPFDRVEVQEVSTRPARPDDIFLDLTAARTGKSLLVGKGHFTGIYGPTSVPGIDLAATFDEAADALNAVVAARKLDALHIGGAKAHIEASLKDTFAKLKVAAGFKGLEVAYDNYKASDVGFDLGFDGGALKVTVDRFHAAAPGGGTLALAATFDANKLKLSAHPRFTQFSTTSYLPPTVRPFAGGRLSGGLVVDADLTGRAIDVKDLDLRLVRSVSGGLPAEVRIKGDTQLSPRLAKTRGLEVTVAGARATAKGQVAFARRLVDLGLDVAAWDLAQALGAFGLPAYAKKASLQAEATGSLDNPEVTAEVQAEDVGVGARRAPKLTGRLGFRDGVAILEQLSGGVFGGRIKASGKVTVLDPKGRKPLAEPRMDVDIEARDLDLRQATDAPEVAGKLSFSAHAHGPLSAPEADFRIPAHTSVRWKNENVEVGPVDLTFDGHTATVHSMRILRPAGGALSVTGTVDLLPVAPAKGKVTKAAGKREKKGARAKAALAEAHATPSTLPAFALDLTLKDLPLGSLPGLSEGVPVKGVVSAQLALRGTVAHPALSGTVDIKNAGVRDTPLGNGQLAFSTDSAGRIHVSGRLFDRFGIEGEAALGPKGPDLHGFLTFEGLALEAFLPEILTLGDGKGRASGRVEVALGPDKPLTVDAVLSELWLSLSREVAAANNGGASSHRVDVRATRPIHAHVEGNSVRLDELVLATNGGELRASGSFDAETEALAASVSGHLDLELLQPFLRASFDRLTGDVAVALKVGGTSSTPILGGEVAISSPVRLRPAGFEAEAVVQRGQILLASQKVSVRGLAVSVDGAVVTVNGETELGPSMVPTRFVADLQGELSARLLGAVAPDVVEDARGRARVNANVSGTLADPHISASLDLGEIRLRPRDFSADLFVRSGVVTVNNEGATLRDVRVDIDQQGRLLIGKAGQRSGRVKFVSLRPFVLGAIDLPLHGEQLTYRTSAVEIADVQCDIDLTGDLRESLKVAGEIRLLAGRYLQDFKVADLVLSPRVDESEVAPFYEDKPLLEDLALDLTVRTVGDAFVVQNNLAPEIHLDVLLNVSGTLSEPAIGGEVRPTDGRFNLPGFRGDFELVPNANHVNFVPTKSLSDGDTPDIYVEAQSLVTDVNGQDHNVRVRIRGPVREMQMDLSTDTGLDRSQTAVLLLTGRTITGTQRYSTSNATVGSNVNSSANIAGQITRDTVANLMEPLIGNAFERALNVNLRFTIGPDGVEARLRKSITRRLSFQFDRLQGFQNQYRQTVQFNWLMVDYTRLVFFMQQLQLAPTAQGTDSVPTAYNLELRWDFPIRVLLFR